MDLVEMLDERLIQFEYEADTKEEIICGIADLMAAAGKVLNKQPYIDAVLKREGECTTGIGMGVAIPHCKCDAVTEAAFALVKLKKPIDWGSLDHAPVHFIIQLAAPDNSDNAHLRMLSQLARNLMDDDFRASLLRASSIEDIKTLFMRGE